MDDVTPPPSSDSDITAPPVVDGRYELRGQLGQGGFGVVYAAVDVELVCEVALKMATAEWARAADAESSLLQEAFTLASVQSPHVVRVLSVGWHRGALYLAMERVRGASLAELIQAHAKAHELVPLAQLLRIVEQVSEGLAAIHAAGVLHLDIKPSNVMIEHETGRPVIIDFGVAVPARHHRSTSGGTPGYMAPEQGGLTDDPITVRSDVYGLAATTFELITGAAPFGKGSTPAILGAQLCVSPRVSSRRPDLGGLDPVFARALAVRSGDRHESCAALMADLAGNVPSALPAPVVAPSADRSAGHRPWQLVVLIIDPDPASIRICATAAQIALFGMRFIVQEARDAAAAFALAAERPPDLVVLRDDAGTDTRVLLLALREAARGLGPRAIVRAPPDALPGSQVRFSILGVKHFLPIPTSLQALVDAFGVIADNAGWRDRRDGATSTHEEPR